MGTLSWSPSQLTPDPDGRHAASPAGLAHQMQGLQRPWCRGRDTWNLVPSGSGRSSVHTGPSSHPVVWAERALAAGRRRTAVYRGLGDRQRETELGKEEGKRLAFLKSRKFIS